MNEVISILPGGHDYMRWIFGARLLLCRGGIEGQLYLCQWQSNIVVYLLSTLIPFLPCSKCLQSRKMEIKAFHFMKKIKMYTHLGKETYTPN